MGRKRGVSTSSRLSALELDHLPPSNNDSAATLLPHNPDKRQQQSNRLPDSDILPLSTTHSTRSKNVVANIGLDGWFYEILALSLAMASFVTLVVVLSRYDGKPTPAWRFGMTINVFASLVSVTFRISIMLPVEQCISQATWISLSQGPRPLDEVIYYDEASRGPLRSLLLIFRLRLR